MKDASYTRVQRLRHLLALTGVLLIAMLGSGAAGAQPSQWRANLPTVPPPTAPGASAAAQSRSSEVKLPGSEVKPKEAEPPPAAGADGGPQPFGSNLFAGNFLRARESGLNPDYVILPGDYVSVNGWGAVNITATFVVDGQGNIFIPEIGPVPLAGVKNKDLTSTVQAAVHRVYARNVEVYTNLLTASPVAVFVTGGVPRPGRYAGIPSDSVLFFLDQAGGIDPKLGSYRKVSVLRRGKPVVEIDLYEFLLEGKLESPQFKDGDTILVHQRGPTVELKGDVAAPAVLEMRPGAFTGAEALAVIPGAARATEVTITGIREGSPISRTLKLTEFTAFGLRDGDTILLRGEGRPETIMVRLEGEFLGSSLLAVRRGARLVDVLNYVAVDPKLANVRAVHLRRPSIARAQKESLEHSLQRLERSALLALSSSNGESDIRRKEAELVLKFVERAETIQPLGRVVTSSSGRQLNVVLEEGDIIVIPGRTNVIRVSGEVLMAQATMYDPRLTAEDYIALSGGYTDRADQDKVIILHPNAEVELGDGDMVVRPGDEVLVPPRVDIKGIQNVADITQIIYQIAVSAAVVIAIL